MKKFYNIVKDSIKQTFKLLWSFKWYILFFMIYYIILILDLLDPPQNDDLIFHAEETSKSWQYTNQEMYIESCKYNLVIFTLLLLLATSNMRNHPLLAKLILLFSGVLFFHFLGAI